MQPLDRIAPFSPTVSPERAAAKTREMAKEFETTLISTLLKEMRQSSDPNGGFFPGDSGDICGGLFDHFLGRHLAEAGGVGIADAILRYSKPTDAAATPSPRTVPADGFVPTLPAGGAVLRPAGR